MHTSNIGLIITHHVIYLVVTIDYDTQWGRSEVHIHFHSHLFSFGTVGLKLVNPSLHTHPVRPIRAVRIRQNNCTAGSLLINSVTGALPVP